MNRAASIYIFILVLALFGVNTASAQPGTGLGPPTAITDTLQDPFLSLLRDERIPVSIYLTNGIKLQGQIEDLDSFVILLKNSVEQMVYKHAISTVVPARDVR